MSKTDSSNRLLRLFPTQPYISSRDKIHAALGALIGILGLSWITLHLTPGLAPFMLASMGASAVLLFATPHSPLTQPWPFVGGHVLSALIGVSCYRWMPDPWMAGATAVALAILAMSLLHCLHPPGGATALTAIIGGDAVHELGFHYVLSPVGINVPALLILSLIINRLLTPHRHGPAGSVGIHNPSHAHGIAPEDLAFAMREIGSFIDVSTEDLEKIHALAAEHAHQRALPTARPAGSAMTGAAEDGAPSHPTPQKKTHAPHENLVQPGLPAFLPAGRAARPAGHRRLVADFGALGRWARRPAAPAAARP
jgi:CBS domain-containing membrane protein